MNVFVTGATGVLGTPVVHKLIAAGHHVRALSRSEANRSQLFEAGAEPFEANLFDKDSLHRALQGMSAVLHLATKIPSADSLAKPGAWLENDRIRAEGTRNLVDAALASDVSTFIYPGIVFGYPDRGSEWLDARTPQDQLTLLESSRNAEASVERFTQAGRLGVVLRMGAFYGPFTPPWPEVLRLARRGVALFFGAANAYQPLIWVDDAAIAVFAALHAAAPGIYDVVDDEPLTRSELTAILAAVVHKRWLIRPPAFLLRFAAGKDAIFLTRSQRVSNRRFREATGWFPEVTSAKEGLRRIAAALSDSAPGARDEHRRGHISEAETVPVFDRVSDARQRR